MVVILPDGQYTVRKRVPRPESEDAFGKPVPGGVDVQPGTPLDGASIDRGDGTYAFRLDPLTWPVKPDDLIDSTTRGTLVVREARLFRHSLDASLDHVGGLAVLMTPDVR